MKEVFESIRQKCENHTINPTKNTWNDLEKKLQTHHTKRKVPSIERMLTIAASIVLITITCILVSTFLNSNAGHNVYSSGPVHFEHLSTISKSNSHIAAYSTYLKIKKPFTPLEERFQHQDSLMPRR